MQRFSANYVFPVTGNPIRNGIVEVDENGLIKAIIDPGSAPVELANTEFHNGIIIPGFVNAHCHTELSHLKGKTAKDRGMAEFVKQVKQLRGENTGAAENDTAFALADMYRQGTSAVADICNSSVSFEAKNKGPIRFYNLIEVLGLDPTRKEMIWERAQILQLIAEANGQNPVSIVPHSTYTLSKELWDLLQNEFSNQKLISIHFAESKDDIEFSTSNSGQLASVFTSWGLPINSIPAGTPIDIVKTYIPTTAKVLFIHNTYLTEYQLNEVKQHFPNAYFCFCPQSNLYIENRLPNIPDFLSHSEYLTIGTDSYASSESLSMLEQIQIISANFPLVGFSQILQWATLNGARALGFENELGSIEIGKKPGLVLVSPFDFANMKTLSNSKARRLV
jgi:cytosine/adenosine deaminase-related metal-dependent hydrolase